MQSRQYECCILGAGPAGLAAALELAHHGVRDVVVVDRNAEPGGLSRTVVRDGNRFDIGPHRFYTANPQIQRLWRETLGDDFLPVRRQTRILYSGKLFSYPLEPVNVLTNLGVGASVLAVLSYVLAQLRASSEPGSYEDWIVSRFGQRLYDTFFRSYTEKVWGVPCSSISAEWASQRIKGLNLVRAALNALNPFRTNGPRTLVEQFDYPRLGAGQMYDALADEIVAQGVALLLNSTVTSIRREESAIASVTVHEESGLQTEIRARHFFTSLPITRFFRSMTPAVPEDVRRAADSLLFREHITVDLVYDAADVFPDQWIYVHSPEVSMARISNYKRFSPAMVGNPGKTGLSVEFFAYQHEPLWKAADRDLIDLAVDQLGGQMIADRSRFETGFVVREADSYPAYVLGFREPYEVLKREIRRLTNLTPIGRGGLFKYNNQDHSCLSGLLGARDYLGIQGAPYDLWEINTDSEYLEDAPYETTAGSAREGKRV